MDMEYASQLGFFPQFAASCLFTVSSESYLPNSLHGSGKCILKKKKKKNLKNTFLVEVKSYIQLVCALKHK